MQVPIFECRALRKKFDGVHALDGVSLSLSKGGVTALIGPNGAGKTTLLNILSGLLLPDGGEVLYRGRNIIGQAPWRIARSGIAMLFQDPRVFGSLTVLDNVLLAFPEAAIDRLCAGLLHPSRTRIGEHARAGRAYELLEGLYLADRSEARASDLSFGQQRLLGIARALAMEAEVFLMDEPSSGLALAAVEQILEVLRHLASSGKAILMIEHDMMVVETVASEAHFLFRGCVMRSGTPAEVLGDHAVREAYLGM